MTRPRALCAALAAAAVLVLPPAVAAAAISAPITNTGIFLIGCLLFFMPTIRGWAEAMGFSNAGNYMIFGLAGLNFLIEMAISIVRSPVIVRLVQIGRKGNV